MHAEKGVKLEQTVKCGMETKTVAETKNKVIGMYITVSLVMYT